MSNKKHYKFVDLMGGRIFHRYWDGKDHKLDVISGFPIELFIKGNRADSKGIHGENLSRLKFSEINDAKEFIKEHGQVTDIYGQTSLAHQFISYEYPHDIEFNIENFTTVSFDLECAFDDSGFPHPDKAAQPITTIACKIMGRDGYILFGQKDYQPADGDVYYRCNSEEEMLAKFIGWWSSVKPDIITGWNIAAFDVPYLINRMTKILGKQVNKLSPFHPYTQNVFSEQTIQGGAPTYRILGVTVYDYLEMYKKFSRGSRESYSLDFISGYELNEAKVDYSEYGNLMDLYAKNFQLYMDYNKHDVALVERLDQKLKYLFLAITIGFVGKVRLQEIFGQVKFWDNLIYVHLLKDNIQIPPHPPTPSHDGIVGAYVKDTVPGLYKWIVSLDLTSLYPSIIMSCGMSPETLVRQATGKNILSQLIDMTYSTEEAKTLNVSMAANGSYYRRDVSGIMPRITAKMFANRKAYKTKMLSTEKEVELVKAEISKSDTPELRSRLLSLESQVAAYDAQQNAFKLALNSLYGATGNKHFRYFDRSIAEGITLTGQLIIRYIANQINIKLNEILKTVDVDYVIASDTDSCYIELKDLVNRVVPADTPKQKVVDFIDRFTEKHLTPYIDEKFAELADYLNLCERKLSMKREAIGDSAIWRGKKNYMMQVYDNEGVRYNEPELKMMGIETARSSTPKIVRDALEHCYNILLNGTNEELIQFVKKFKTQFMSAPIDQIASPRGVSDMFKWVDKVTRWKTGTPIHVKASLVYNELLAKHNLTNQCAEIRNGDKIKFVYLKEPNPARAGVIGFIDILHPQFNMDEYIDRQTQYDKTFMGPLVSFTSLIGFDTERKIRLDSFFSDDDASTSEQYISAAVTKPRVTSIIDKPVNKTGKILDKIGDKTIISDTPKVVKKKPVTKKVRPTLDTFFD